MSESTNLITYVQCEHCKEPAELDCYDPGDPSVGMPGSWEALCADCAGETAEHNRRPVRIIRMASGVPIKWVHHEVEWQKYANQSYINRRTGWSVTGRVCGQATNWTPRDADQELAQPQWWFRDLAPAQAFCDTIASLEKYREYLPKLNGPKMVNTRRLASETEPEKQVAWWFRHQYMVTEHDEGEPILRDANGRILL